MQKERRPRGRFEKELSCVTYNVLTSYNEANNYILQTCTSKKYTENVFLNRAEIICSVTQLEELEFEPEPAQPHLAPGLQGDGEAEQPGWHVSVYPWARQ